MKEKKSRRKQAESIDACIDEPIDESATCKMEDLEQGITSESIDEKLPEKREPEQTPGEKVKERARQRGYW